MTRKVVVLVLAGACLFGITASAHHSFNAVYDVSNEVTIEGKLVQFLYRNPHSWVHVEVTTPAGEVQRWAVERGGTGQLAGQGATVTQGWCADRYHGHLGLGHQRRLGRAHASPRKGDYPRVPMTPAGRKIADAWDPARDQAAGEQCRAYGAAGVTRLPGRLRVSWQDDNTMKMDFEAGTQTRLLHFGAAAPPAAPSWQGHSVAEWQVARNPPRNGELKVVTSRMRPGYLRTNGVPYGANATMTEYFHLMKAPNGDTWLTVVAEVIDPENLREPIVQSSHFKKVADSTPFRPEPCSAS